MGCWRPPWRPNLTALLHSGSKSQHHQVLGTTLKPQKTVTVCQSFSDVDVFEQHAVAGAQAGAPTGSGLGWGGLALMSFYPLCSWLLAQTAPSQGWSLPSRKRLLAAYKSSSTWPSPSRGTQEVALSGLACCLSHRAGCCLEGPGHGDRGVPVHAVVVRVASPT